MSGDVITVTCETCARTDEYTPLIAHRTTHRTIRSNVNYFYICVLMLVLVAGFTIGCYLLYKDKEWDDVENYPFIIKAYSDDKTTPSLLLPLNFPVKQVYLLEFPDEFRCQNKYDCLLQLITTRNDTLDMYNFLVDKRTIYEGLGWKYRSANCEDHILRIATFNVPAGSDSVKTTQTVASILDHGILTKKLSSCFNITYFGNSTNFKEIASYMRNISDQETCAL